jgi:hypothetical protein
VQAGEKNLDILLRNSEDELIGIYPKLEEVKRLQELTDFKSFPSPRRYWTCCITARG